MVLGRCLLDGSVWFVLFWFGEGGFCGKGGKLLGEE